MSTWSVTTGGVGAVGSGGVAGMQIGVPGLSASDLDYANGIVIKVMPANGGTIISVRSESPSSMLSTNAELYVIHSDQDLGAEIGKIITMHYLKKEPK